MPFRDPAARAAYMKSYWAEYHAQADVDHGDKKTKLKARQAEWFRENADKLRERSRISSRESARRRRAQQTIKQVHTALETALESNS